MAHIDGKFYPLQASEWEKAWQELNPADIHLLYFIRTIDPYSNGLPLSVTEVATKLGRSKSTVSSSFQVLQEKGYINTGEKIRPKIKFEGRGILAINISASNVETSPESYAEFLASDYWKQVRKLVIDRDGCCQMCKSKKSLQVHHLTYKHHKQEHKHLEDLVTLCSVCHEKAHSPKSMEESKTYVTPDGDFVTEEDDGTVREATPEEAEKQIEEWEQQQEIEDEPEPEPENPNTETSNNQRLVCR